MVLIVPLLLAPLALSVLNATPVSAQTAAERIKGWLAFKASHYCFHGREEINGHDVDNGGFGTGMGANNIGDDDVGVGVYYTGSGKGFVTCNNLMKTALPLWGYSSFKDLITDAGYTYDSSSYKYKAPKNKTASAVWDALRRKKGYKNSAGEYLSALEVYYLYHESFKVGCSATEKTLSSATENEKAQAKGGASGYASYATITKDGNIQETFAKIGSKERFFFYSTAGYIACSAPKPHTDEIDKWARKAAPMAKEDALVAFYKGLLPNYASEKCKDLTGSEKTACENKYNNAIRTCVKEALGSAGTSPGAPPGASIVRTSLYSISSTAGSVTLSRPPVASASLISASSTAGTTGKKMNEAFASCYSRETGISEEEILGILGENDPSQVGIDPESGGSAGDDPEAQEDACGIDKVGWMACPVTSLLATVMDNLYSFLASNFLQTETAQVNNEEVEKVWRSFRDIANVAFVIAFMIIIYSQLTSVGLSNYGIKRMLPKLLVAAILVNLSYTLCILAVDLSNLLGYGVNQIFHAVGSSAGLEEYAGLPDGGGGQWALVFGGLLAGAVGIALAGGWSVLLAGLLAALMIVLILVLRKAAIIVLIVISPLAFVAYLLPNTEKWFHQWFKAFYTLLMLFPIIGAVFAGSKLAGDIIGSTAKKEELLLKVVSLGVSVVPLFVVPSLLKGALASLGTLGTKLQGMADRRTERMRGAVSGKAKERFGRTSIAQAYKGAKAHRNEMKTAKGRRRMHQGLSGRIGTAIGGKDWRERAENRAMAEEQKEIDERVSAAAARQYQSMTYDERVALAQGKDLEGNKIAVSDEEREAAVKYVSEHGNVHERQAVLASLDDVENKRIRQAAVSGARKNGDSALYGAGTLGAIEEGKHSNGNNFQQMMSQSMVKRLQEGEIDNGTMHRDAHTANLLANASMGYSTGADGQPNAMKPIDAGRDANGNLAATSVTAERRDAIRDSAISWQQTEDGQGTGDKIKQRWKTLPGKSNQSGGSSGSSNPSGSSGGGGSDGNLNVRRGNRPQTS